MCGAAAKLAKPCDRTFQDRDGVLAGDSFASIDGREAALLPSHEAATVNRRQQLISIHTASEGSVHWTQGRRISIAFATAIVPLCSARRGRLDSMRQHFARKSVASASNNVPTISPPLPRGINTSASNSGFAGSVCCRGRGGLPRTGLVPSAAPIGGISSA